MELVSVRDHVTYYRSNLRAHTKYPDMLSDLESQITRCQKFLSNAYFVNRDLSVLESLLENPDEICL
jgi:hypothetical protein